MIALTALGLVVGQTAASAAEPGYVQVRVVQDTGAHGYIVLDTIDPGAGEQTATSRQVNPPLIGTVVTITDANGNSATASTNTDGIVTFTPTFLTANGLSGAEFRIDVANPKPGTFYPGFAANNQTPSTGQPFTPAPGGNALTVEPVTQDDLANSNNEKLSSTTEFVDIDGKNAYVNTSFWFPDWYSQDNAPVVDAAQPWDAPPLGTSSADETTLFSTTYHLDAAPTQLAQVGSAAAGDGGDTTGTGTVFGIAYDQTRERIYSAAYAKRGSGYGPGGPGGIYVTDLTSSSYPLAGTTTLFAQVPDAGDAAHDMAANSDYGFFNVPGTQSLGDIDITNDDHYLFGVNENNNTVFVYDLTAADPATSMETYTIPNPCGIDADWHPMGTGVGMDTSFVGGVCSPMTTAHETTTGQMDALSAYVYAFDPSTGDFAGQVLHQPLGNLAYDRGLVAWGTTCAGGLSDDPTIGRWFPWLDSYPLNGVSNPQSATGCGVGQIGWATPMLGDIVQETNGDLVLSFRNRFSDQSGWYTLEPNQDGTFSQQGQVVGAGDVVRGCQLTSGDYVLDPVYDPATMTLAPGATCGNNNVDGVVSFEPHTYREFYAGDVTYGNHQEASFSGIALSRSEPTIISSAVDPAGGINTQGIHAMSRDGMPVSGLPFGVVENDASIHFTKGMGIADLEVLAQPAPIQIGNRVWQDSNGNGVQDAGETPIAGVTVDLYDANGNLVGATTTNESGVYYFDDTNVDGGLDQNAQYTVKLDNPDDYVDGGPLVGRTPTQADAGDNDEHDSDGTIPAGQTFPQTTLTTGGAGEDNHSYDFGFTSPVSIGDYMWIDADGDGVQDQGETPVPGATVNLLDADGNVVATTETDDDGFYAFTDLPPNTDYTVQFPTTVTVDDTTYYLTQPTQGGDDAADSNPDQATGEAPVTTPPSGDNSGEPGAADDPTIDAGYVPPVSVGDYVWIDGDDDGVQDAGEPPVPDATVTLLDSDGNVVATTRTDDDGYYAFTDLPPDTDYTVQFPTVVTVDGQDYVLTPPGQGGDEGADSNPDQQTGQAPVTTPHSGDNSGEPGQADDPTIDAGYHPKPVSIGDYVWIDADGDGVQDAGEAPVPGATVTLLDSDGNPVATTTTDDDGYYSFTDLVPDSDYTVQFPTTVTVDGDQYVLTPPAQGGDDAADSNPDATTGEAPVTTPLNGDNSGEPGQADDPTIDAGYTPVVSIGDYVWIDADGDGVQDQGEVPVPGATVNLLDADGNVVATTETDDDGYYAFTDLPGNTDYTVQFPTQVSVDGVDYALTPPAQGGDGTADSNPDQATGEAPVTTPASGANSGEPGEADDPTIDAGYTPEPVSVGDYVWIDSDGDGVQDQGEVPVPGATVNLLDADGNVVATTETDDDGYYAFTDLPPGADYTVQFPTTVTVDGIDYALTPPAQGGDDTADSNPDQETGLAPVTTPLSGDNSGEPGQADNPTIDAGYTPEPVSVGDYVWIDSDGDGVQDAGESPVPGATVTLLDSDGNVVATTETDDDGYYAFTDLPPDTDYTVQFPTTVTVDGIDYALTPPAEGGDDTADSNPDQQSGLAPVTTPKTGDNSGEPGQADNPTIDAGYFPKPVSVGDYVWIDSDGDGVQDAGESPVPGATVTLLDSDGNVVATTTTDEDGYYAFTDLVPDADYTVEFPTTVTVDGAKYQLTSPAQGGDDAADSNPDQESGLAPVTTPLSGDNSGEPGEADNPTIDAGYTPVLVSVGDYVWVDSDGDGVQDAGESPVPGATVTLLDSDGNVVATTTTDEDGYYAFTDLPPDTEFTVQFPTTVTVDGVEYPLTPPGQGDNPAGDSNPDQGTGRVTITTPSSGRNSGAPGEADNPTIDAGYVPPAPPVAPTDPQEPTSPLPDTGVNVFGLATTAMSLLLGGALALVAARRRRRLA